MQTDSGTRAKYPDPIVASAGAEEASINELLEQVESRLDGGVDIVVVDCAQLNRVTSSHINALWQARERCGRRAATLELVNVGSGLRRVLEVLDLTSLFFPGPPTTVPFRRVFAPTVDEIDGLMSKFVGFLTKVGVPEVTAFELQTVFYEMATNIRRHSGLTDTDSVELHAQIKNNCAILTLTDGGVAFDPTAQNAGQDILEASRELPRRGFGLTMIRRLSDSMEYERTVDGRNRLRIRKGW